jgi:endonuclease/exonuclease/phosphatase family metal-dependent hydrolase
VPEKLQFLEDLKPCCPATQPTLLVGDFNLILQASDKNTNNYNRRLMAAFRRFTNDNELEDMYMHGRRYTWSNEQADAIKVKLDRALMNEMWSNDHPNCILQALSSDLSDHCPLLLTTDATFTPPCGPAAR